MKLLLYIGNILHIGSNMVKLTWSKYENDINIDVIRENNPENSLALVRLLCLKDDLFFSIAKSFDEMTICYDKTKEEEIGLEPDHRDVWVAYRLIETGSLMEESGLVNKISELFKQYEIPIMYMTTYNNNYVMVPKKYEEKVSSIVTLDEY